MTSSTPDQPTHTMGAASDVACPACWAHDSTDCTCGTCGRTGTVTTADARLWITAHPACGLDAAGWAPEPHEANYTFHFDFNAPSHEAAVELGAAMATAVAEQLEQLTSAADRDGRPVPVAWDVSGTNVGGTDWSVIVPRPDSLPEQHCR